MEKEIPVYFSEVEDPRVESRGMHLLSDILTIYQSSLAAQA
jgi:hypothetical protein